MTTTNFAIRVTNLSKNYPIYPTPKDRLKQSILSRLRRFVDIPNRRYYSEFRALNGVSFEVRKGETVGVVGRNGSGKSTLLQLICGTLTPTSGSVEISGRIAALLELGSGFDPAFTGRENVYLNGALLGLARAEIDARFAAIAEFADIGDFIEQPVKTYSSGMTLRLAFAVAINVDPEILIVDEALAVGDELFQRKCYARIDAIKRKGATILFVSHSGSTIVELCDRALLLDGGEFLGIGEPKRIVASYQKLLYAPSEQRAAIRHQLLQTSTHSLHRNTPSPHYTITKKDSSDDETEEYYDSGLKPTSTLAYESQGALIEVPAIYTVDGRQVNGLIRGRDYRYCYRVRFDRTVERVRFAMLIKTVSGLALGGALSAPSLAEAVPEVPGGTVLNVTFTFRCIVNPGTYFLNAGVLGCISGDETVIHRLVDAAAFRVLPVQANTATEMVDFNCVALVDFDV